MIPKRSAPPPLFCESKSLVTSAHTLSRLECSDCSQLHVEAPQIEDNLLRRPTFHSDFIFILPPWCCLCGNHIFQTISLTTPYLCPNVKDLLGAVSLGVEAKESPFVSQIASLTFDFLLETLKNIKHPTLKAHTFPLCSRNRST